MVFDFELFDLLFLKIVVPFNALPLLVELYYLSYRNEGDLQRNTLLVVALGELMYQIMIQRLQLMVGKSGSRVYFFPLLVHLPYHVHGTLQKTQRFVIAASLPLLH